MPVVVEGIVGLRKALNAYAPDLKKEMDKTMRDALKPIVADAKAKVPAASVLYNWNEPAVERKSRTSRYRAFPSFNAKEIRSGLTYSIAKQPMRRSGFVSLFTLLNRSAVGAIIETAGRLSGMGGSGDSQSNNPDAGRRFIGAMNQVGGLRDYANKGQMTTGRLLYAAYDRNEGKALDAIMKAIDVAAKEFERRARESDVRKAA